MAGERILVADDEPHIVRTLGFVLKKAGYSVASAGDGEEALSLARELMPHIILVDAMMPGLDGYEVCRRLRRDPDLAPQPFVIMLTGSGQDADRDRSLEAGVNEFMTKPFSPSKLLARLEEIIKLQT